MLLLCSLVGGCSFPTNEFTLGGATLDVPVIDTPPTDNPVVDTPVADTPPTDTPVVDTPPTDTPVVDTPPTDTPVVDVPTTDTPGDMPSSDGGADASDASDVPACPMSFQIRCATDGGASACINPLNDTRNCGICGRACAADQSCLLGGCQLPSAGYTRESPTAAALPFIDVCTTRVNRLTFTTVDDAQAFVELPFPFTLFRTLVTSGVRINVSTNGFLSLQNNMPATTYVGDIPSMAEPNGVVAPFWTDLILRAPDAAVCAATVGTAPTRKFVVQWNNVSWYTTFSTPPTMTFEAILYEGSNQIDFVYQTVQPRPADLERTLTIGVENLAGLSAFAICNSAYTSCGIDSGRRVRLVPM